MAIEIISSQRCFDGLQQRCRHRSQVLNCEMPFSVYLPPQCVAGDDGSGASSRVQRAPVLYWLSGLTCSDENFMQKAGAQRVAAELGLVLVAPDTSPRGPEVADAPDGSWDLGQGAGFYLNATEPPWLSHYRMYDYLLSELPALIESQFPVTERRAISGHSMGGHGALVLALRNPGRYCSVSALSPITNPSRVPWGRKAFTAYLGSNEDDWRQYDSCELIRQGAQPLPLLIDQGGQDEFLGQQLTPEALQQAAAEADFPLQLRMQPGYDHSYWFVASFIEQHLRFHAAALRGEPQLPAQ